MVNIKRRTSLIWKISDDKLNDIVQNNTTLTKILLVFGLKNKGGNFKTLKSRLDESHIDYSHIPLGLNRKGKKFGGVAAIPLNDILVVESTYNRGHLKRRLIKAGWLLNMCSICGQLPFWRGNPLVLIMDHINGISDDNRLVNLRLLCPNCNSQTETFAGRNISSSSLDGSAISMV